MTTSDMAAALASALPEAMTTSDMAAALASALPEGEAAE